MTLLAFLVTVAYIPGWTGAAIPTGWAFMSVTLPWANWKRIDMTLFHWLGLAFLTYACVSVAWAPRTDDAINELWHWTVIGLAFVLGARLKDLRGFWKGMAIGVTVSSMIAIAQWFAGPTHQFLPNSNWAKPPGLFYNDAVAGAVAAIVIVGLVSELMWKWVPGCLPLLLLSQSRGAWVALIGTAAAVLMNSLISWRDRIFFAGMLLLPALLWWYYFHGGSDPIRWVIWQAIGTHLNWSGSGAGSTMSIFLLTNQIFHIEHAHNDYLQLIFEYGIGTVPLILFAYLLLEHRHATTWPAYVCCLILSVYFWTLESPVTAFPFAIVAGALARDLHMAWCHSYSWGLGRVLWFAAKGRLAGAARHSSVSFQLGS